METTIILGLYWDNGKENGNYYSLSGLYWGETLKSGHLRKNGIFEVGTNAATEHDEQNEHVQRQNEKEFAKKKIALETGTY